MDAFLPCVVLIQNQNPRFRCLTTLYSINTLFSILLPFILQCAYILSKKLTLTLNYNLNGGDERCFLCVCIYPLCTWWTPMWPSPKQSRCQLVQTSCDRKMFFLSSTHPSDCLKCTAVVSCLDCGKYWGSRKNGLLKVIEVLNLNNIPRILDMEALFILDTHWFYFKY